MITTVAPQLIPDDVRGLCRRLRDAGHAAYLVGGGIRDALLGRPPNDFDVATDAHPDVVLRLFGHRFAIPTGLQHGTVTVLVGEGPRPVEVTTFRGEGEYLDARRPSSVHFGATLDEDLSRRDFTMNAIAYDPASGQLVDPFDGQGDLARKLVRAVRDPIERFTEDGLRAMRAVRQATQLGFAIEPATLAAIPQTLASFRKVSAERVRDELLKLLAAERPSRGIELMRTTGLLAEVLPEVLADGRTPAAIDETRGDATVRLAALLGESAAAADAMCRRLRLSTADRGRIVALVTQRGFVYSPDWTDGDVRRFVRRVGADLLDPLLALREADTAVRGGDGAATRELRRRIADVGPVPMSTSELAIDGKDVMRILAIGPGRHVGVILSSLLERVLDDPTLNDRATLERLVRDLPRD